MNFKKNWKRFWTLNRHAEGFTLVELIVVIAILAILAAVAVPAYSAYVTKANKQADQTLVGEVVHALTLYYYSTPGMTDGYVVLTTDGTACKADAKVGTAAMDAVFGDNWEETLSLAYNEWTDDGLLNEVAGYTQAQLDSIAGSTYMTVSTPEGLMTAVNNMTDLVNQVVGGSNLSEANNRLNQLLGEGNSVVTTLNNLGITYEDDNYSTVVSNLLVKNMADNMQTTESDLTGLLTFYSTVFAYAEQTEDDTLLKKFDETLEEMSYETLLGSNGCSYCEDALSGLDAWAGYEAFMAEKVGDSETTREEADVGALMNMMSAVSLISGSYTDEESLSDSNLYTSSAVGEQVNNYVNSVKALANMSESERAVLQNLPAGSVAVFITANGSVSVIPGAAWLAS